MDAALEEPIEMEAAKRPRRERVKREDRVRKERKKKEFSILYVDDEMPNLRGFKSSFKRTFNIFIALSGQEAIEIINNNDIHLVVSDHRMPEMNGTDLLKEINDMNPDIRRMILSGFIKRDELKGAVESFGIHEFVTKPWDFDDLMGIFDRLLKNGKPDVMSFG